MSKRCNQLINPVWTAERLAILRRNYPANVPSRKIAAECNRLPGRHVSNFMVSNKANSLGIRRPDGTCMRRTSSQDRLSQDWAEADFTPVYGDFEDVAEYARESEIKFKSWDDLPAVNAARERSGLPTFRRSWDQKGRYGAARRSVAASAPLG